jgi:filamentous hemagglutinin family protein
MVVAMVVVRFAWLFGMTIGGALWINSAVAQVTPDGTLGAESSIVIPNVEINGVNSDRIDGGATRGSNLFHSFEEFNIDSDRGAYFSNPSGIENIITRVTGGSASNINGTLGVLGSANLFLINPNGIVFGPNARLDVGGSFLASTASSFNFADGTHFSATAPQTTPLLTVSVPLGLQFGFLPGNIENRSVATNSSNTTVGLSVAPGRTLALVGGNVQSSGGLLQAPNGQIQLGGVAEPTTVGLEVNNSNFSVKLPKEIPKADVSLNNSAVIDVRDRGAGSVEVTARNIEILGGSRINAGIREGLTAVGSQVGDITLNATDAVRINQLSRIINSVAPNATGNAGNININAGEISITNLASEPALSTSPSGNGRGRSGDVSLVTTGSIFVTGQDVNPGDTVISTFSGSRGLGTGNISLQANGSISLNNAFFVTSAGWQK